MITDEQISRLDGPSALLFAAECAERVLLHFERAWPGESSPAAAIAATRAFACGMASVEELHAASVAAEKVAYRATHHLRDDAGYDISAVVNAIWSAVAATRGEVSDAIELALYSTRNAAHYRFKEFGYDTRNNWTDDAVYDEEEWQAERLATYLDGVVS